MMATDAGLDLTGFHQGQGEQVIQRAGPKVPSLPEAKNCENCGHIKICKIHTFTLRFLEESFTDDTHPFGSGQLAVICKFYFSGSSMHLLSD